MLHPSPIEGRGPIVGFRDTNSSSEPPTLPSSHLRRWNMTELMRNEQTGTSLPANTQTNHRELHSNSATVNTRNCNNPKCQTLGRRPLSVHGAYPDPLQKTSRNLHAGSHPWLRLLLDVMGHWPLEIRTAVRVQLLNIAHKKVAHQTAT